MNILQIENLIARYNLLFVNTVYIILIFAFMMRGAFTYDSKKISHKALTDLEDSYIQKIEFNLLYNFMRTATSLTGYKHTDSAKGKMIKRFEDKTNHPF